MLKKMIKVIKHYPYSNKIILPKKFCQILNIKENEKIICQLDEDKKEIILKKRNE